MEKHIKQRWDDKKLDAIVQHFGITSSQVKILDGFESFIYEYERDGQGYILRVSHSARRNEAMIQGEVDWLNFLAKGGARVAQAIESENACLVEAIEDGHGEQFLATAFRKAAGQHLGFNQWTDEFMQHYGETIAQLHRLSKNYRVSKPEWERMHWDDPSSTDLEAWAKIIEPAIMSKAEATVRRLQALPQDESYHIVHQDAHGGNFYVDDKGQMTLFDFDDCMYGHEIYDIAMIFFYGPIRDNPAMAEKFARNFLNGYVREHQLDPKWLAHITDFMRLREYDLYAMIERDVDWRKGEDQWAQTFMQGRRERLLHNVPFVDFDFTTLADLLI